MKYEELAKSILDAVGGPNNVKEVRHCATRLRFKLKDNTIPKDEDVRKIDGVINIAKGGGQYQIIIGNTVPDVYKAVLKEGDLSNLAGGSQEDEGDVSTKDKIFQAIQGIFVPIIFVMAAAGIMMGLNSILVHFEVIQAGSGTNRLLSIVSQSVMQGLPVLVGYSAVKVFGGSQILGVIMGLILIHPFTTAMAAAQWEQVYGVWERTSTDHFFGFIPVIFPRTGYVGTVVPIIGAVFVLAKLELWFNKTLPSAIKAFFVPFLALLIATIVTFAIIGPLATFLTEGMASIIDALFNFGGGFGVVLTGLVLGGLWQVLVVFGIHHAIPPIALIYLMETGNDTLLALTWTASFAQLGSVAAVAFKTRNEKLKAAAIPATVSAVFGVTEPAIYGVTLPLKKPFIVSCLVSSITAAFVGLMGVARYRQGGWGLLIFTSVLPGEVQSSCESLPPVESWSSFIWLLVAVSVAALVAFAATYFVGFDDPVEEPKKA